MTRRKRSALPALEKDGPIADRARKALQTAAEQFGRIDQMTKTTASVVTSAGLRIEVSYELGNFLFSRVYSLQISTDLPDNSPVPSGLKLSFRGANGPRFIRNNNPTANDTTLESLNEVITPLMSEVDLVSSTVQTIAGNKRLTLSTLGGSFVWVLIPPVFKPTAFPDGEPHRIINLIAAMRNPTSATDVETERKKGPLK